MSETLGVGMQASERPVRRLALPTHLLSTVDDPVEVVKKYVCPYSEPGDIVTIGETPLAAMQGRWRHPASVRPGWLARLGCKVFKVPNHLAHMSEKDSGAFR